MLVRAAVLLVVAAVATGPANAAAPRGCAEAQSRATMRAFVAAFNRGDVTQLDALFATQPDFKWYSSGTPGVRLRTAAITRSTLVRYFAARHRAGDRLRLVKVDYNGISAGYGHFGLVLRRAAGDFRDGTWFSLAGKGAISCASQPGKIAVLSLGGPDSVR